ncbi:uncharacterized protein LOC112082833 [Eutrema salsugineum]|uniref:uncharacterized protein LOC112082833 n=1 Tax=Eutrema salsugineum TaxID=72664 RepID=UPI000CED7E81|nr:uncharacterized protein LOC112082833 [Eutrema salsugineum]
MTKYMANTKGSKINSVSSWSIQIVNRFGTKNNVVLNDRKCTCQAFQKLKIPCGHALFAADSVGLPYASLVGDCYKTSTWAETYQGVINPEANLNEVEVPMEVSSSILFPPKARRPSGRPKELRIPSTGEIKGNRVSKSVPNKCGRCRLSGHNRSSCTNPI